MTNLNAFAALQFRIMEVLEKSGSVPLTAMEISNRLHEGEYRDQLKDTVIHKVTQTCHAMKDKGKILLSDARDKDGRLTYVLPARMIFPPKTSAPPANPVLRAEVAAKIVTAPPKPAPKAPVRPRQQDVTKAVIAMIAKAPHPLTSVEIADMALTDNLWPGANMLTVKSRVATLLHGAVNDRKIKYRPSSGRVPGVKFEYFTRKTGHGAQPPLPLAAPVVTPKPAPAPAAQPKTVTPGLFRPVAPVELDLLLIKLAYTAPELARVEAAAKAFGVPTDEFCKQAIEYAMAHAEGGVA